MNTPAPKSILASKTFWGALLAALPTVLSLAHDPATLTAFGLPVATVVKVVGISGALLAIYGRCTAAQPVNLTGS